MAVSPTWPRGKSRWQGRLAEPAFGRTRRRRVPTRRSFCQHLAIGGTSYASPWSSGARLCAWHQSQGCGWSAGTHPRSFGGTSYASPALVIRNKWDSHSSSLPEWCFDGRSQCWSGHPQCPGSLFHSQGSDFQYVGGRFHCLGGWMQLENDRSKGVCTASCIVFHRPKAVSEPVNSNQPKHFHKNCSRHGARASARCNVIEPGSKSAA
jgi:hypothetical protein